jgi:hypothetical protein
MYAARKQPRTEKQARRMRINTEACVLTHEELISEVNTETERRAKKVIRRNKNQRKRGHSVSDSEQSVPPSPQSTTTSQILRY